MSNDQNAPGGDALPFLEPSTERAIEGVAVHVAGEEDVVASDRTLTIQESSQDRWVGRIDADLGAYAAVRLEVRMSGGSVEFTVGPRVRGETLISGLGPAPGPHRREQAS